MPRNRRSLAALATVLAMNTAACVEAPTDVAVEASTLRIGLLVSLTGPQAPVGSDLRNGFELYLKTHDNRLGGHPIELKVADEGDGPPTALPAATKLIKVDKVIALTGVVGAGSVAAIAPVLEEARIPMVGSYGRPEELQRVNRIWHTSFVGDEPGAAIAKYLKDNAGGPVYVIGQDQQGGPDALRGFTGGFIAAGGQLANPGGQAAVMPVTQATVFAPYFAQIKATGAKAVYACFTGRAATDFVKQYAQSEVKNVPLYGAGFLTEGSVLNAQGSAARGVLSVLNYSPDLDNEENRKFVAAWKQFYPDLAPTTYAMASYDAAAVLDRAILAAGAEPTADSINDAIASLGQIPSPRGAWQFGRKHHTPIQRWYLRQVRNDGRALSNVLVQDLATLGS